MNLILFRKPIDSKERLLGRTRFMKYSCKGSIVNVRYDYHIILKI